jgi:hypothetical protein
MQYKWKELSAKDFQKEIENDFKRSKEDYDNNHDEYEKQAAIKLEKSNAYISNKDNLKKYFSFLENIKEFLCGMSLFPKEKISDIESEMKADLKLTSNFHFLQNEDSELSLEKEWKKAALESIAKIIYAEGEVKGRKERVHVIWLILAIIFFLWTVRWITENWEKDEVITKIESAQSFDEVNSIMNEYIRKKEFWSTR